MSMQRKAALLLSMVLMLALLAGALPAALAEKSLQAVVTADAMNVYSQVAPHDLLGSLPRGTKVTVEAYSGNIALISYKGYSGLAQIRDMQAAAETAPTASEAVETTMSKAVVAVRNTRIYKKASTKSRYVSVKAGTGMTLLGVNGNCAKVERNGAVGYTAYSHLGEPEKAAEPAPATEQEPEVKTGRTAVVTTQATRIYKKASTRSASVRVGKGTKMVLTAVRGSCAQVEYNGAVGYTYVNHLASDTGNGDSSSKQDTGKSASSGFSSESTEYVIYKFLTGEMGLNRAAAMGVIANIKYESGFKSTIGGDGGTSYGLCQWHLGRKTNLINWCKNNNFDYTTVEGQLHFLQYELTTRYPSVLNYLKKVDNTAEGAYDAAYYFCFNFEAPAARTSQSTARGKYARDTLYKL